MNIVVEARALSAGFGGIPTYVSELTEHLRRLTSPSDDMTVLYDSEQPDFPLDTNDLIIPLAHPLLLSRWLNGPVQDALKHIRPDVVHFTKADVPRHKQFPTVVTIYDTIPLQLPQTQSFFRRFYWPSALRRAATQSDHIITIAERNKQSIMRYFDVPAEKISVTPLAVNTEHFQPVMHSQRIEQIRAAFGLKKPYILFVGTWDRRKNVEGLIRAFAAIADQVPHDLVIAGRPAYKRNQASQVAASLGLQERVRFFENVSYQDLPVLYSAASLFAWPSAIEGWGFPPQEAMACGTPVIVSNADPLPEVVGDAGDVIPFTTPDLSKRFSDTEFEHAFGAGILKILQDEQRATKMKERGLHQARMRTWNTVAQRTLEVYRQIAQQ